MIPDYTESKNPTEAQTSRSTAIIVLLIAALGAGVIVGRMWTTTPKAPAVTVTSAAATDADDVFDLKDDAKGRYQIVITPEDPEDVVFTGIMLLDSATGRTWRQSSGRFDPKRFYEMPTRINTPPPGYAIDTRTMLPVPVTPATPAPRK